MPYKLLITLGRFNLVFGFSPLLFWYLNQQAAFVAITLPGSPKLKGIQLYFFPLAIWFVWEKK